MRNALQINPIHSTTQQRETGLDSEGVEGPSEAKAERNTFEKEEEDVLKERKLFQGSKSP